MHAKESHYPNGTTLIVSSSLSVMAGITTEAQSKQMADATVNWWTVTQYVHISTALR